MFGVKKKQTVELFDGELGLFTPFLSQLTIIINDECKYGMKIDLCVGLLVLSWPVSSFGTALG